MPLFYLETSAIVKHYRSEPGSDVLSELLTAPPERDRFWTSLLSIVEVSAAIYRQVGAGRLREPEAQEALARFRTTRRERLTVRPLSDQVVRPSLWPSSTG